MPDAKDVREGMPWYIVGVLVTLFALFIIGLIVVGIILTSALAFSH